MKILITGAAGYVGSALAKRLETQDLLLIDNYSAKEEWRPYLLSVGKHEIINGDILDREVCKDITQGIDVIYHLAAVSGINNCEDIFSCESNLIGTINLGIWAEKRGVKKIIFASTSAVYGESQAPLITEEHKIKPRFRYGWQKYICELFLQTLRIPCVILRKSNIYGQGLYHKNTAVDNFIDKAIKGEDFTITGKGLQRRDYIHIEDVVNAYIQATYWDSGIYNIGGKDNLSINELADLIIGISGKNIRKIYNEKAESGAILKKFTYDYSKAKVRGYNPQKTIKDEAITRFGNNKNLA